MSRDLNDEDLEKAEETENVRPYGDISDPCLARGY